MIILNSFMHKFYIISTISIKGILHLTLKAKYTTETINFAPGQYVCISFIDNKKKSPFRCFSITSVPGSDELELGIKISGKFTEKLSTLKEGTDIELLGPYGEFVVDSRYDESIVLIAGGIGITPFMSIIRSHFASNKNIPILLLYSSRTSSNMPYISELIELEKKYPKFRMITFISEEEDIKLTKNSVKGVIQKNHLERIVKDDYLKSTYFVCGPKSFNLTISDYLAKLGISAENIITESFSEGSQIRTLGGRSVSSLTYLAAAALVLFGIGSISFIDLARYVPKHTTKENNNVNNQNNTSSQTSNTSNNASSSGNTSSNVNTYNQTSTQNNNNYYQPPTSHVS